jgi:hypothetical protein
MGDCHTTTQNNKSTMRINLVSMRGAGGVLVAGGGSRRKMPRSVLLLVVDNGIMCEADC